MVTNKAKDEQVVTLLAVPKAKDQQVNKLITKLTAARGGGKDDSFPPPGSNGRTSHVMTTGAITRRTIGHGLKRATTSQEKRAKMPGLRCSLCF